MLAKYRLPVLLLMGSLFNPLVGPVFIKDANAQGLYDVKSFELFGIRLGMSADEATPALAKYFDTGAENIAVRMINKPAPIIQGNDVANQLSLRIDGGMVYVNLSAQLSDKGIESSVITSITLDTHEEDNLDKLVNQFVEQFGPYTLVDDSHPTKKFWSYRWCTENTTGPYKQCGRQTVSLTVEDGYMTLFDQPADRASRDAFKKWKKENG